MQLTPTASAPSPVHQQHLAGALDRASASSQRAWTIVQSMADGERVGSARLDDHLAALGKHLAVAGSHAARAGAADVIGALGGASSRALETARVLELPDGQRMYPPSQEQGAIDGASGVLVGVEQLIGDVRTHLGIASSTDAAGTAPARSNPADDVRLVAWAKQVGDDIAKIPADIARRYPQVVASMAQAAPTLAPAEAAASAAEAAAIAAAPAEQQPLEPPIGGEPPVGGEPA